MSNQALALREEQGVTGTMITDVQRLGSLLAASGYFQDAREMAQAAVKVLAGQELGIPPIAAMMGIHVIKGKVALSANLIASRVRAHGYDYRHKQFDDSGCVLEFLSKADTSGKRTVLGESSFTEADAKTAQCFGDMYKKFPRNMYFSRSMSNGAKWYTPEVFAGTPVYTPEELGARVDAQGDMIHEEPISPAKAVAIRKIAEMAAGKTYAEVSEEQPEPDAEQAADEGPATDFKAWLEQMAKARTAVGDETYYRILGVHGFEHANQIKDRKTRIVIYRELKEAYNDMQAARPVV